MPADPQAQPPESRRHYLLSPVSACLARLYLLKKGIDAAEMGKFPPDAVKNLRHQVDQLEEKLKLLQDRVTEVLGELNEPEH